MDKFSIEVERDDKKINFQIVDYAHDDTDRCKFEVYLDEKLVASFQPDRHGFLHICKNTGSVEESLLHLLADKIESLHI
jgi:predicted PilT family ATPase